MDGNPTQKTDAQENPAKNRPKLQTLKGFRDFLPKVEKKRQFLIDKLKAAFELFGFEPLQTPALEYKEVLFGKSGDETEKQVYTFTDQGGREVALRFDQTVPTARVLGMYQNELTLPFRRYQMQNAWRAENTQSGRYREFLQCDADIYGSSSTLADAEIIALTNHIYDSLGFKNYKIYINDRKILFELMHFASIAPELQFRTVTAIDKLDRKTEEEVSEELRSAGLSQESIKHLFHHLKESELNELLKDIIDQSVDLGVDKDKLVFQARLARGLDYYTGMIFEVKIDEYKAGSVLGGGRYDKLIKVLSGVDVPAVGFGLGFDRTLEAMSELALFPDEHTRKGGLVTVLNEEYLQPSLNAAALLRNNGIECEVYPDPNAKLEKQLKFADKKGIKWLIVIGPQEAEKDRVILKDLETGHQEDLRLEALVKKLKVKTEH